MLKSKTFLALLSGILLSLSWPTYGFPFLIFFAFVPLFFLEEELKKQSKSLFLFWVYSFLALIIWNLITTWWIWNSTDIGAVMAIFLNSLFMSFVWLVYSFSMRYFKSNRNAIFLLPIYWVAFEYLHLDWDLSWSWLNLGNVFAQHPYAIQWYEYTGTFGGSFWILIVNILVFQLLSKIFQTEKKSRNILLWIWPTLAFIFIPLIFSLVQYITYEEKGESVEIVVLQPNMDPWSEQFLSPPEEVIQRCINLSKPLLTTETQFLLAPESAIQEHLLEPQFHYAASTGRTSVSMPLLKDFLKDYPSLNLVIGLSSYAYLDQATPTARLLGDSNFIDEYNTAILMNYKGVEALSHKSKLVPGPEKMPFQTILGPIQETVFNLGGTVGSLGSDSERTIFYSADKTIAAAPLICYESIYGGFVAEFVRNGAQLLFIITNDGWWGDTQGHQQHMAYARLRAIECRRSVARTANTGISGFINQRGDLINMTKYWEEDARKASILANTEYTFFVRYGDYLGRLSVFLSALLLLVSIAIMLKREKQ